MPNKKISELTAIDAIQSGDFLVVGDTSASNEAKKATPAQVKSGLGLDKATLAYALICDGNKSSGTAGGGYTSGSWVTRDLNTEVKDDDNIVSIASNRFTLQAGKYRLRAVAPACGIGYHRLALYNYSDTTYLHYGPNNHALNGGTWASSYAELSYEFTIGSQKTFEIRHRGTASQATNGLGGPCSFGVAEVYCQVEIWKIA